MNGTSEGRNGSFVNGAASVHPQFQSQQVGAGHEGFTPNSVLEENHVLKNPNGMSAADRARQPVKGLGSSINGQSDSTFNKRMWIGSPYRTFG